MSCTFNSDWMDTSLNPQFLWVRPVKDSSQKAMCSLCKKTFFEQYGETSLDQPHGQ